MLKVYAIILSALFLVQSVNIHFEDAIVFNELIEHAEMHQAKYGDNFIVFISKHYGEQKSSHAKLHKEEEKNHDHPPIEHDCNTQIQTVFTWQSTSYIIEKSMHKIEVTPNFCYQDQYSIFEKKSIFQPPQFA